MRLDNILAVTNYRKRINQYTKKRFDWREELENSFILAGLTFVTTFTLTVEPLTAFKVAGLNALITFFTRLAIKKKLISVKK